jgi:hypothetical protein
MRLLEGRSHPTFDMNGHTNKGPRGLVKTTGFLGGDVLRLPDDPELVRMVADSMNFMRLGENCYVLRNVYNDERSVPYGASIEQWKAACKELMDIALEKSENP